MTGIESLRLIDVADQFRKMYGPNAAAALGRPIPEHDYRFEVVTSEGSRITFNCGATAADVAEYLEREGIEA